MILLNKSDVLFLYKSRKAGLKALEKYSYLFPLHSSTALSGLIGDLFGDGHLQGNPKWRFDFTSNSVQELQRFEKELYSVFVIKGSVRKCVTNKYSSTFNYGVNNKPIARILFLCGTPIGNKVINKISIPRWILENKALFRRFIQRLLDCEGCVDVNNKYIELNMSKSIDILNNGFKFFNDIKKALYRYFKIDTIKPFTTNRVKWRNDGIRTKEIKLKIKKRASVIKFYKYIGFENNIKQGKLIKVIEKLGKGR